MTDTNPTGACGRYPACGCPTTDHEVACEYWTGSGLQPVEEHMNLVRLTSLGDDIDQQDAQAVLVILRATARTQSRRRAGSMHIAREALWSLWERPRLPKPLISGKYPRIYLWSAAARTAYLDNAKRPTGGWGLVLEHITPRSLLIERLWEDVDHIDAAELVDRLFVHLAATVVTKAEDDLLTHAGVGRTTPDPDDIWSRYRHAGLDTNGFAPLDHEGDSTREADQ